MGLIGDILEEVSWLVEDTVDTFTTGVKESVAPPKVKRARNKVRVWKRKYKRELESFKNYQEDTAKLLKEHYSYKEYLKQNLLEKWINLMKDSLAISVHRIYRLETPKLDSKLSDLDIDLRLNNINYLQGIRINSITSELTPNFMSSNNIGLIFDLIDQYVYANDILEDAKDFQVEVEAEIEKLARFKSHLKYIRKRVEEERLILENLEDKLKVLIKSITLFKNQEVLSIQREEQVKISAIIADAIAGTLNTRFVDKSATITEEYKIVLGNLNKVSKLI